MESEKKLLLSIIVKFAFLITGAFILFLMCQFFIKPEGAGWDFSGVKTFFIMVSYFFFGMFILFLPSVVYCTVQVAIIFGMWYNFNSKYVREHMTKEEFEMEMITNLPKQKEIFLKKLEEGEIFTPNEIVYKDIKLRTKEKILDIVNAPCTKSENDSLEYAKTLFYRFVCFDDSMQTMMNKRFITESCRIDTMFFSSKFDKLVVFISYGKSYIDRSSITKKYYESNSIIGQIVDDTLIFGPSSDYFYHSNNYPTQDCAFYNEFNEFDDRLLALTKNLVSFTKKDFWDKSDYFKKVFVENKEYLGFQYYSYEKRPYPLLKVPIQKR